MESNNKDFYNYFSQNLIKGFIYLAALITMIVLFKNYFKVQYDIIEHWVSDDYVLMLVIFLASEIFVGLLPPELFMVWSIDDPGLVYSIIIIAMAIISLVAGLFNYWVGTEISNKPFFKKLFLKKRLKKYQKQYDQYGGGLIIVAALTPIPYALICLLTGSLKYPVRKFLMFSSFRFLRFIVYGLIIWNLEGWI
ncbi:MAG: membrane protein YqaA with SNARE-associated domain [Roseivirga sp.]|jgi:membrane protein YqaA with SNARE-associated domain